MEFRDNNKPASKRVALGYLILIMVSFQGLLLIIGYEQVDPSLYGLLVTSVDQRNIAGTLGFFIGTILFTGVFPWFLGRSALKKGNDGGKKLMKMTYIIPICYIFIQIVCTAHYSGFFY